MANRYYIPPRRNIMDLAQLGLQFYNIQRQSNLTEKEQASRERTETRRAHESKVLYGSRETPPIRKEPISGELVGQRRQVTDIGTIRQAQKLGERKQAEVEKQNQMLFAQLDITTKPISIKEMARVQGEMNLFDKNNDVKIQQIISPEIYWVKSNFETNTKYNIYKGLKEKFKMNEARIDEDFQKQINAAYTLEGMDSKKAQILSQRKQDILTGKWLDNKMPLCAQRAQFEQQVKKKEMLLAQTKLMQAQRPTVLGADQTLHGPGGALLATGPERTGTKIGKPGDTVMSPTGKKLFTLGPKPPTQKELLELAKEVRNVESIIQMKENEGKRDLVQPYLDFFNRYAKKPYVYKGWTTKGKNRWEKIQLPKVKGKQTYAEDIWTTMRDTGMTFQEVLNLIGAK